MNGGLEFLFWIVFFSLILISWIVFELVELKKPDILPPPRCDLVCRTGHDHWRVSDAKDLVIGK